MKKNLEQNNSFYKELLDNLYDGVYFVDRKRRITYWNHGAERISGYTPESVIGSFCHDNILQHIGPDGTLLCQNGCPLLATMQDGESREWEVTLRHTEGYRLPVLVRTSPIYDKENKIIGAVEIFSNNQSLMKMKRRVKSLEHTVIYDPLTGIGNRSHMEVKIKTALQEFQHDQAPFGIIFIDIDHFKEVNDRYGHNLGDKVLHAVANTLRHNLRESDTCGRWGGEEFLALVFHVDNEELTFIAEKLRILVGQTYVSAEAETVNVTVSMGVTRVRRGDTLESLVHRADQLMYQSKAKGRNFVSSG
jgi:diguanylate cyclase (GGDEF)-like protein/PAS domain S-box-containing protein